MRLSDYQKEMMRTAGEYKTATEQLLNGCLGLAGEAGEVCDIIKKFAYQGHDLEFSKLEEELGDVMWYMALISNTFAFDMESILQQNIDKLKVRYPNGFRIEDSIKRVM